MNESAVPQSSSNVDGRKLAVFAVILAVVGGGFYLSNERTTQVEDKTENRAIDVNQFLIKQCERDEFRNQVIIGALQDAKRRAQRSIANEFERAYEVGKIQFSIDELNAQNGECRKSIPPPVTG